GRAERSFARGWRGLLAEDSAAPVVGVAGIDQFVDPLPRLEGGVELDQRVRPENASLELRLDVLCDPLVANLDEAPDVLGVVADQAVAEVEDVHAAPPRRWLPRCLPERATLLRTASRSVFL